MCFAARDVAQRLSQFEKIAKDFFFNLPKPLFILFCLTDSLCILPPIPLSVKTFFLFFSFIYDQPPIHHA